MTGWTGAIVTALAALGTGMLLLRSQRNLWALLAAVVVFGLAGYAWQGSPTYPAAPARTLAGKPKGNVGLVDARHEFFSETSVRGHLVTLADGFARKGDFGRAARILQGQVTRQPRDGEAWLALGIALVEHAGGRVSPPAEFAMAKAREALPGNPGPAFFDGVNALREGDLPRTRAIWAEGIAGSEPGARGRGYMEERLAGLDRLMEAMAVGQAQMQEPASEEQAGVPGDRPGIPAAE